MPSILRLCLFLWVWSLCAPSTRAAELHFAGVLGNSGVTFDDAAGTDTNLRSYWSNQSTGLVDDIPGEIMLSPNLWGEMRIGK